MACEIRTYEHVFFVLWGKPQLVDLDRIEQSVATLQAQRGEWLFIARVPKNAELPSEQVRSAISKRLPKLVEHCVSYHVVFEGTGFIAAAKRAALSTMFFMSGRRHTYHTHALMEDVARAAPPAYRSEVLRAFEAFSAEGLLSGDLASLHRTTAAALD